MKKLLTILVASASLWTGFVQADDFDAKAEHAIAIEVSTGKVLYEKNATEPDGIASITKLLTVYMVYKEVAAGNMDWDDLVDISDYPYELTANTELSNVPMEKREYTVKQLVDAAMVASANSAAIALAEHISGSESKFVDKMNEQLQEWGIKDATIINASGLNNQYLGDNAYPGTLADQENMMSARSVVIIGQKVLKEFPEITKVTNQVQADFDDVTMNTYNYLLPGSSFAREGVDGLKTGTTDLAGASLIASSTENKMRVVVVVLNADGWQENDYARFEVANDILNYVADNYEAVSLIQEGDALKGQSATILDGKKSSIEPIAKERFQVIRKINNQEDEDTSKLLKFETDRKGYTAKIDKGQRLGKVIFQDPDIVGSGYVGDIPSMDMVAPQEIKRSFFLKVWWNHFVNYVNEKL